MTAATIEETTLDEFYSRDDRRDVLLVKRGGAGKTWYVIRYSDVGNILGFNSEPAAREAFRRFKIQAQNP
jgi:hypothetical protein